MANQLRRLRLRGAHVEHDTASTTTSNTTQATPPQHAERTDRQIAVDPALGESQTAVFRVTPPHGVTAHVEGMSNAMGELHRIVRREGFHRGEPRVDLSVSRTVAEMAQLTTEATREILEARAHAIAGAGARAGEVDWDQLRAMSILQEQCPWLRGINEGLHQYLERIVPTSVLISRIEYDALLEDQQQFNGLQQRFHALQQRVETASRELESITTQIQDSLSVRGIIVAAGKGLIVVIKECKQKLLKVLKLMTKTKENI